MSPTTTSKLLEDDPSVGLHGGTDSPDVACLRVYFLVSRSSSFRLSSVFYSSILHPDFHATVCIAMAKVRLIFGDEFKFQRRRTWAFPMEIQ